MQQSNSYPLTNNSATANPAIFTYRHRIGYTPLYASPDNQTGVEGYKSAQMPYQMYMP